MLLTNDYSGLFTEVSTPGFLGYSNNFFGSFITFFMALAGIAAVLSLLSCAVLIILNSGNAQEMAKVKSKLINVFIISVVAFGIIGIINIFCSIGNSLNSNW